MTNMTDIDTTELETIEGGSEFWCPTLGGDPINPFDPSPWKQPTGTDCPPLV